MEGILVLLLTAGLTAAVPLFLRELDRWLRRSGRRRTRQGDWDPPANGAGSVWIDRDDDSSAPGANGHGDPRAE